MKSYVISLSTATQRRSHIAAEFGRKAVDFEFFDAITPDTVEASARFLGLDPARTKLHRREIACLFSHVTLWKKAVDEHMDHIAIFEDDIYLGENADAFLKSASWIPPQCGIVKLEAYYKKIVVLTHEPVINLSNKRRLMVLGAAHMGGGGYILSRQAARQLIDFLTQCVELFPVDHVIFRDYPHGTGNTIHQMVPALCIQDVVLTNDPARFPSNLKDVRSVRKGESQEKRKMKLSEKAKRETGRVLKQIHVAFHEFTQLFDGKRTMRIKFK